MYSRRDIDFSLSEKRVTNKERRKTRINPGVLSWHESWIHIISVKPWVYTYTQLHKEVKTDVDICLCVHVCAHTHIYMCVSQCVLLRGSRSNENNDVPVAISIYNSQMVVSIPFPNKRNQDLKRWLIQGQEQEMHKMSLEIFLWFQKVTKCSKT